MPWLIYYVSPGKSYCFDCRQLGEKSFFVNEGFDQWQSCTTRLKEHEKSHGHLDVMTSCRETEARLNKITTTGMGNIHQKMFYSETKRWI